MAFSLQDIIDTTTEGNTGGQSTLSGEQLVPQATVADVPVATMESSSIPLDIPQAQVDTGSSIDVAETALEASTTREKDLEKKNEAADALSAEQGTALGDLKKSMDLERNEAVDRAFIEDEFGVDDLQRDKNETTLMLRQGTADLRAFDLQTIDDRELARRDAGGRDITKGVFGAKDREFSLQRSIQRSHKASDLESLAAVASYQAGDVLLAQQGADRALAAIYDPIRKDIENKKFFHKMIREDLTAAQKAQSDAQLALMTREEQSIDAATILANKAVAYALCHRFFR